jgi:YD repeat-containing protein
LRISPLVALALLFALCSFLPTVCVLSAQDHESTFMSSTDKKTSSERETAGLRGPVRAVIEERTYPASTDADGKTFPGSDTWNKTEYDRDGRISATFWRAPEGEHGPNALIATRCIYTASGKLLKRTVGTDDKIESQTDYDYDDRGRLKSITNSNDRANPVAFQYDSNGRKTKIVIEKPVELPDGMGAVSSSAQRLFEDGTAEMVLREGGSTITQYDELDRPREVLLHDVHGTLTSRAVRVYDQQGRVTEEKMLIDDPVALMSGQQKGALQDAAEAQQLREQLAAFLGGSEMWSTKYKYDDKGRKVLTLRNTFNQIAETITTSYNDQGDVIKELTTSTVTAAVNPAGEETRSSETVYSYEYDANGNWTRQRTSLRELPDGALKDQGNEVRRMIEYY